MMIQNMTLIFNTDNNFPLNKQLYFPTITITIRNVFEKDGTYYQQVYSDDCLYHVQKMIQYKRIDISEEIDFNKIKLSLECMICHYWCFKKIGFKYQPYVCNRCQDFSMIVQNFSDFLMSKIRNVDFRCYIVGLDKEDAINLLNSSTLNNKGVL